MNASSGYVGWSMSRRALEAYKDGEMPKSKWTKKAMAAAIQAYCDEFDMLFDPNALKGMRKDEVFERFFYKSSWHHTSKFFNETNFYKLDEDAVCGSFRPMTETEVAERDAVRRQASRRRGLNARQYKLRGMSSRTVIAHTVRSMDSIPTRWPRSHMSIPSAAKSASAPRAPAYSSTSTISGKSERVTSTESTKPISTVSMRPNQTALPAQSSGTRLKP